MRTVEGETFRGTIPFVEDVRYRRCTFDNGGCRDLAMHNVEFVDCAMWSVTFRAVVFEDCLIENLKTRLPGQTGGKTMPLFFWGCLARHLTLRGTLGGFMWNPPHTPAKVKWSNGMPEVVATGKVDLGRRAVSRAERFYKKVDWAVDISEARFRSVPTFSYGPPGELFVRDAAHQPLVSREVAQSVDWKSLRDSIGIWWVTMTSFNERPWPATKVLIPALGGSKVKVERELSGIAYMRGAGMTID